MEDIVLHTGAEHPDLLWILGPALLSFVAGLGSAPTLTAFERGSVRRAIR